MVKSTAAGMPGADSMDGDGGPSPVTAALLDLAKARKFDGGTLADDMLRALLEQIRHMPKPFQQMTADGQADVVESLRASCAVFVDKGLKLFAADDRPHIKAKVKSVNADGSKTKLALEIHDETAEDVADIYRVLTRDVVVILADSNDYMSRGDDEDLVEADQKLMEFDADDGEAGTGGED